MIIDQNLRLSSGQSYNGTAGTYYSTNVIDLQATGGPSALQAKGFQIDKQAAPQLVVRVGTAYAGGTSVTYNLISATSPWTAVAGTGIAGAVVLASSGAILTAALTANTEVWKIDLPVNIPGRYLGVQIVEVGNFTAGTHDCFFTGDSYIPAFS